MAAGATDDVLLPTTDYAVAAEKATGGNSAVDDEKTTGAGVDGPPLPLARTNALRQRLINLSASSKQRHEIFR